MVRWRDNATVQGGCLIFAGDLTAYPQDSVAHREGFTAYQEEEERTTKHIVRRAPYRENPKSGFHSTGTTTLPAVRIVVRWREVLRTLAGYSHEQRRSPER